MIGIGRFSMISPTNKFESSTTRMQSILETRSSIAGRMKLPRSEIRKACEATYQVGIGTVNYLDRHGLGGSIEDW